jgi:quinol monooxygenase YgiN
MLIVVARYVVSEGHESTVARLLRTNAEASRAEPGCFEFSVYREIDDPRAFLLYARYADEVAFQAHRRTPHFGDIIERRVAPLLEERAWTRVEPLPVNPIERAFCKAQRRVRSERRRPTQTDSLILRRMAVAHFVARFRLRTAAELCPAMRPRLRGEVCHALG